MALPNLRIEPWEMPTLATGTPAVAPATWRVFIYSRPFLVRCVTNAQGDNLWVVQAKSAQPKNYFCHLELKDSVGRIHDRAGREFKNLLQNQGRRIIYLDANLCLSQGNEWEYGVEIKQGYGLWICRSNSDTAIWELERDRLTRLWEASADRIREEVLQLKSQSTTDCAFAFRWVNHDWRWRAQQMTYLKHGTHDEFENLIRLVTRSDNQLNTQSVDWTIEIMGKLSHRENVEPVDLSVKLYVDEQERSVPQYWTHVWSALQNYFAICINEPLIQSHLAMKGMWNDGLMMGRGESWFWEIDVLAASAHERMEARLQWRDWVQMHVPQAQWRTLLPYDEVVE